MPVVSHKILAIAKAAGANVFVESGTCKGSSLIRAMESKIFTKHFSVEIEPDLFKNLMRKLPNRPGRTIFLGRSTEVFEKKVFPQCRSADSLFFWLDGHFSAGPTGGDDLPCPLLEELECIQKFCPTKNIIIAIDDTDDFGRSDPEIPGHNWPGRVEIEEAVSKIHPDFHCFDYSGLGKTEKINRGVMVYARKKPGMNFMNISLCRYSLILRQLLLDLPYKLKKWYRKYAAFIKA